MNVIKSRYTSEELQHIYDDAEKRVEKDVVKKIERRSRVLTVLCMILGWTFIGIMVGICTPSDANLASPVKDIIRMFFLLVNIGFSVWATICLASKTKVRLIRFYEKRGRTLENPLASFKFEEYIRLVKTGEWLSSLLENNPETRYLYLLQLGMLMVFEAEGSRMRIVKKTDLHEIGCKINTFTNSDVLDFSVCDEDIARCIATFIGIADVRKHRDGVLIFGASGSGKARSCIMPMEETEK